MANRPIVNALICTGCIRLIRKSHFGKISCLSDSTFQCVSLWLLDFIFVLFLDVKWLQNFKYYLTWYLTTFQYLQCCIILSFVLWFCVPKPLQTIKHYFKRRNTSIMTSPYQCKNTLHRSEYCWMNRKTYFTWKWLILKYFKTWVAASWYTILRGGRRFIFISKISQSFILVKQKSSYTVNCTLGYKNRYIRPLYNFAAFLWKFLIYMIRIAYN